MELNFLLIFFSSFFSSSVKYLHAFVFDRKLH